MKILAGEPNWITQMGMLLVDWVDRRFGRKLSFGEMFQRFEDQERLKKLLKSKGFTFMENLT